MKYASAGCHTHAGNLRQDTESVKIIRGHLLTAERIFQRNNNCPVAPRSQPVLFLSGKFRERHGHFCSRQDNCIKNWYKHIILHNFQLLIRHIQTKQFR